MKAYYTQELNANISIFNINYNINELNDKETIIHGIKNKSQCILSSFNNTIDKYSSLYTKLIYDNYKTLNSLK